MRPAVPATPLDEAEEHLCRRFSRAKLRWAVVELALLLLALAGLTLSGAAAALAQWALERERPPELGDAAAWLLGEASLVFLYLCGVGLIARLVTLPAQFASGYLLERRFGLCRQSAIGWLADWALATVLYGMLAILFLTPLVLTIRWCQQWYWCLFLAPLWLALFFVLRAAYYRWLYLPLLRLFYPVRFLSAESFFLPGIGRRQMPVYEVEVGRKTRRCNATVLLSGGSGSVLVTDTLVDQFSDAEEKVVIAHEFGHLYDHLFLESRTPAGRAQALRKLSFFSGSWYGAAVLGIWIVQLLEAPLGLHADDLAAFPLEVALVLVLLQVLAPLAHAESRIDEREADEYALRITGDRQSYLAVMNKLRRINLEESQPGLIDRWLYGTHPSYLERLKTAGVEREE
jgi:STE24 endopeptidase